jgi:hypothetical protein
LGALLGGAVLEIHPDACRAILSGACVRAAAKLEGIAAVVVTVIAVAAMLSATGKIRASGEGE